MAEPNKFEKFLRKRLKRIVDQDILDEFLTPESMKVWTRAFTDQSYSTDNYELYEIIGDSAISLAFYDVIQEAFPTITQPKIYSTLKEFYLSEVSLRDFAINAGFLDFLIADRLVLSSTEIKRKIAEDLWESYHGALKELGDKIGLENFGIGVGYQCVKNSMIEVLNELDIDKNRGAGAFKNQLSEIMSALGIRLTIINYPLPNREVSFAYFIRRDVIVGILQKFGRTDAEINNLLDDKTSREFISRIPAASMKLNPKVDHILLGAAIKPNKEEAQDSAASDAIKTFRNRYGLTDVYLDGVRAERLDAQLDGKGEIKENYDAIAKIYSNIKISGRTFSTVALYILTGVKNGRNQIIALYRTERGDAYDNIQAELYRRGRNSPLSRK